MSTTLPANTGTNGITDANTNNGQQKTNLAAIRSFIADLFGTDTAALRTVWETFRLQTPDLLANVSLGFSVASSALTIALKTRAAATPSATDPVLLAMRSATAGNGDFNLRAVTAATSLVVSSDSTLGQSASDPGYLYVYAIDFSGTIELAISKAWYGESGIVTTTAEGGAGAADSGAVMYSTTARTSVPFRALARLKAPQTVAGTWAAVPTSAELVPFDAPPAALPAAVNLQARTNASTPNSKIDITADAATLIDDAGNAITVRSVSVTVDITASGINGRDTGSEASNTTYYGWLVAKSDGTIGGVVSTSSSAPTMPSGYTFKMLASVVRNDGSSNFIAFRQRGRRSYFEAPPQALTAGTATTETAISLSTWVPAIAQSIVLELQATAGDAGAAGNVALRVVSGSRFATITLEPSADTRESMTLEVPQISQQVYYIWSSALTSRQLDVYVTWFDLPLLAG